MLNKQLLIVQLKPRLLCVLALVSPYVPDALVSTYVPDILVSTYVYDF